MSVWAFILGLLIFALVVCVAILLGVVRVATFIAIWALSTAVLLWIAPRALFFAIILGLIVTVVTHRIIWKNLARSSIGHSR
jgi:hypothetical protein